MTGVLMIMQSPACAMPSSCGLRYAPTTGHGKHAVQPRDKICMEIADANALQDCAKQIPAFAAILSNPAAERFLSRDEIGNVHWNKALAHTEESHRIFSDLRQPVTALRHCNEAVDHMSLALLSYDTASDREQARTYLDEMKGQRDSLVAYLQDLVPVPELNTADSSSDATREASVRIYRSDHHPHKFYHFYHY